MCLLSPLSRDLPLKIPHVPRPHPLSRGRSQDSDACREVGVSFVSLLVETIGGWSEIASQTITSIGHLHGKYQGSNLEDTTRHLFQCLSISLWWGNSTMWVTRSPTPFLLLMVSYNTIKNNNNDNDNNK